MKSKALTDSEELALRRQFPDLGFLGRLGRRMGDIPTDELFDNHKRLVGASKRMLDDVQGERLSDEQKVASDAALKLIDNWGKELQDRSEGRGSNRPRIMSDADLDFLGGRRPRPPRSLPGIPLRTASGEELRALGPKESFSEYLRESGKLRDDQDGMTFGRLMAAMIRGPRDEVERHALAEGSDSTGGVTVPVGLLSEFIDALRPQSRVVEAGARTIPLSTEKTSIARITTYPTPGWRDENDAVANTSDPAFDAVTFTARSLALIVPVSRELVADSINIESALTQVLSRAVADELDRVCLLGSGIAPEPKGLSKYSPGPGLVSMGDDGAALANYDPFLDALQKIQDANANDSDLCAILAPRTNIALAKLKDDNKQPLQIPPALRNVRFLPTTKVPVNETQGGASNASRVVLGDYSQCWIGMRLEARVEVLRELLAANYQLAFLVHLRADVQFAHLESFCQITGIIPPAA